MTGRCLCAREWRRRASRIGKNWVLEVFILICSVSLARSRCDSLLILFLFDWCSVILFGEILVPP